MSTMTQSGITPQLPALCKHTQLQTRRSISNCKPSGSLQKTGLGPKGRIRSWTQYGCKHEVLRFDAQNPHQAEWGSTNTCNPSAAVEGWVAETGGSSEAQGHLPWCSQTRTDTKCDPLISTYVLQHIHTCIYTHDFPFIHAYMHTPLPILSDLTHASSER